MRSHPSPLRRVLRRGILAAGLAGALAVPASALATGSPPAQLPYVTVLSIGRNDVALSHKTGCDPDGDFGYYSNGIFGRYDYGWRFADPTNQAPFAIVNHIQPKYPNCSTSIQNDGKSMAALLPCNSDVDVGIWVTDWAGNQSRGRYTTVHTLAC